ncbi:universal stress protein [Natronococcus occultus]|uniref:Universal stress protein UspA-like protein n=1 Tax=Natronococcus occultus SP4 TaxID=694430 RepID=L0K0C4_9EURY|nr:universal stress protein [Natronococcus occultus]AGB38000.1 universal stress protein UspA-like protein [Natronococcus occultus SP4]
MEGDGTAGEQYTIVVALSNPAAVEQLLRSASDLATRHDGRIHAIAIEHKPVNSPFLMFSDEHISAEYAEESTQLLERAEDVSEVPITTDLRVDSNVPSAIRGVVDQVDANVLLMGWRERASTADAILGSSVDPILRRPPCDVLVERMGTVADGVETVLVPTVGGPHAGLASDVAAAVAAMNGATVTVLSVVTGEGPMADPDAARRKVRRTAAQFPDVPVEQRVVNAPDSAAGILEVAVDHDLVVLGATGTGLVRPPVIGSVADTVARESDCPVLIAKRRAESRLERLFERVGSISDRLTGSSGGTRRR